MGRIYESCPMLWYASFLISCSSASGSHIPSAGIEYFPATQSIVLALASASFHSFCLFPYPAAIISTSHLPSSTELTLATRKLFVVGTAFEKTGRGPQSRSGKITRREGAGLYGFASTGNGQGDLAFIYE